MNRREVLQLVSSGAMALGTARSPLRERAAGPLADDSWDQDRHGTGPTRLEGDHVSFRDLARRMDFARPARRVWGNGPLSADRPDASCGELVTYRGTEYVPYPGVAARYAYDLGMINRFEDTGGDDSVVALTDLSEKGILECHRFVTAEETETGSTASGGSSTADGGYSLRAVADRHRRGVAHRCLWLNTRLVEDAKEIARRDHLIGEVLGVSGYDIVGLGEVFREAQFDELVEHYRQSSVGPIDVERGPARARCCGLAAVVATENGKRGIDGEDKWESVYDVDVPPSVPWDTLDGAQRVTVEVVLPDVENAAFDLFLTHLDPYNTDRDRKERRKQVDILVNQIEKRRRTHGQFPKVLMGDMNIHAENSFADEALMDYEMLLAELHSVGMQSVRLTRGGPGAEGPGCTVVDGTPWSADSEDCPPSCFCDPFDEDEVGKDWIDYVFVEEPREEHAINLDLSRMWRVPLNVRDCTCLSDRAGDRPPTVREHPTLADHVGLGFELVTSPR